MCILSTLIESSQKNTPNYHHGNLRAALLAEGLVLLELNSLAEFKMRDLSSRLGVTANASYRHFASKDALLTAMAAEGFRMLVARQAERVQDSKDPIAGFVAAGSAYVHFARLHPALFRLMYSRFAVNNPDEEIKLAAQFAHEAMRFSAAAALNKPVDDVQVTVTAAHAWSLVHGLSNLVIDGQFESHKAELDQLISAVLQQAEAILLAKILDGVSHHSQG